MLFGELNVSLMSFIKEYITMTMGTHFFFYHMTF